MSIGITGLRKNMLKTWPSTNSNSPEQSATSPKGFKRFGKKLYLIVFAVIAVAIIVGALLVPQGAATIPEPLTIQLGKN